MEEIDTVDNYHEALKSLIESKSKGKKTVEFEEVGGTTQTCIMSALKKSLQQSSRKTMVKAESTTKKKPQITLVKPMAKPRLLRSERRLAFSFI